MDISERRPAWLHFSSFDINLLLLDIFSGVTYRILRFPSPFSSALYTDLSFSLLVAEVSMHALMPIAVSAITLKIEASIVYNKPHIRNTLIQKEITST